MARPPKPVEDETASAARISIDSEQAREIDLHVGLGHYRDRAELARAAIDEFLKAHPLSRAERSQAEATVARLQAMRQEARDAGVPPKKMAAWIQRRLGGERVKTADAVDEARKVDARRRK